MTGTPSLNVLCCQALLALSQCEGPVLCVWRWGGGEQIVASVSWTERNLRPAGMQTNYRWWVHATFMALVYIVFPSYTQLISSFLLQSWQEFCTFCYFNSSEDFLYKVLLYLHLLWQRLLLIYWYWRLGMCSAPKSFAEGVICVHSASSWNLLSTFNLSNFAWCCVSPESLSRTICCTECNYILSFEWHPLQKLLFS